MYGKVHRIFSLFSLLEVLTGKHVPSFSGQESMYCLINWNVDQNV